MFRIMTWVHPSIQFLTPPPSYQFCPWPKFQLFQQKNIYFLLFEDQAGLGQFLGQALQLWGPGAAAT